MRMRRGLTLVELMVVIAVLGVLIALILPAVQAARESARRLACQNHLHQIGVALTSYHTSFRAFPINMSGHGMEKPDGTCQTGFFSWLALLLPWMEQDVLYRQIDFRQGMADGCDALSEYQGHVSQTHPNAQAAATVVPAFLCPSDNYSPNTLMGTARVAPGSYAANAGWPAYSSGPDGLRATPAKHNGFMAVLRPWQPAQWHVPHVRESDITDGLSHTAAVAERRITSLKREGDVLNTESILLSYCGGSTGSRRPLGNYAQYCSQSPDASYSYFHGRSWISGWTLAANTYMHVLRLGSKNCHLYGGEGDGTNLVTPSSLHPGGINVLMADGHVTFVRETVDTAAWWAAGSRNGSELLRLE